MKISRLHRWDLDYREAAAVQARLAEQVVDLPPLERVETVAAADVSAGIRTPEGGRATWHSRPRLCEMIAAVVVVMRLGTFEVVEVRRAAMRAAWPYVPGMLSFREAPVVLAAFRQIRRRPDLVLLDGQGRAHPRRMGLASHLGLALGVPTVGCAKSRLIGEMAGALGQARGSRAPLVDAGERVGTVLRTRAGTRPVYVSVGSGLDLASAERWVLASAPRYRLPDPARLAHQLVTQYKRELTARGNP